MRFYSVGTYTRAPGRDLAGPVEFACHACMSKLEDDYLIQWYEEQHDLRPTDECDVCGDSPFDWIDVLARTEN